MVGKSHFDTRLLSQGIEQTCVSVAPFVKMLLKSFRTLSSVILFTQISHVLSLGCGTAPDNEIATSDNATVFRRQDDGVRVTCELGGQGNILLF